MMNFYIYYRDGNNAHHSPLLGPEGAASTIQRYIRGGINPQKLNLGFATYGLI